jgi:type III secretion YscU/HrpY family protein
MSQEKTEEPTPKKLREARRRGEVAKSREVGTAAVVLAAAAGLSASAEHMLSKLRECFSVAVRAIESGREAAMMEALRAGAQLGIEAILPVVLMALAAGTFASFLQVGALLTFEPLAPKLQRIDPVQGAKNLVSQKQWVELVKTLLKMALVGYVAWVSVKRGIHGVAGLAARDAGAAIEAGGSLVFTLLVRVGGAMAAIAVLDVLYQRWRFRQDQKMTKEEVKREHKETEGDPHAKQHRERTHREVLEHSALEEVRTADVLVVNPTHLAVALRYDDERHEAPEVIAKGQDELAQRMIRAAHEAGVPVMRDVPLARALHELELGEEIPERLYEAVAAVLRAAWKEQSSSP